MSLLKDMIFDAGVVGAGGAGFPSSFKLADNIDTILINAAECEPLLMTDFHLLKTYKSELCEALKALVTRAQANRGIIALKRHNAEALSITEGAFDDKLEYKILDDIYPAGDELVLIKEATGKVVPSSSIPISVGVVVYNLETLYNIKNAFEGIPVTEKFITVAGDSGRTYLIKVPIGTPLEHILKELKLEIDDNHVVIEGGPAMGRIINVPGSVVTKTTKGYVILPDNIPAITNKRTKLETQLKRAASACCGCRMCTDLCPRHLLGYNINPHKVVKTMANNINDTSVFLGAFSCSSCGVCETVACCQGLSPKAVFAKVKADLIKQGIKPEAQKAEADKLREYRKIPSSRMMSRLGIDRFYRSEYEIKEIRPCDDVIINIKQHIGGAFKPCVEVGDLVSKGQPLVEKGSGLGALIHSSADGTVFEITESYIKVGVNK